MYFKIFYSKKVNLITVLYKLFEVPLYKQILIYEYYIMYQHLEILSSFP